GRVWSYSCLTIAYRRIGRRFIHGPRKGHERARLVWREKGKDGAAETVARDQAGDRAGQIGDDTPAGGEDGRDAEQAGAEESGRGGTAVSNAGNTSSSRLAKAAVQAS